MPDPRQNDYSELIVCLDEKFPAADGQFEGLKIESNNLQTSVDAYAKKADAYFQEMLMLSREVDRLERWVMELADKLNVHLKA